MGSEQCKWKKKKGFIQRLTENTENNNSQVIILKGKFIFLLWLSRQTGQTLVLIKEFPMLGTISNGEIPSPFLYIKDELVKINLQHLNYEKLIFFSFLVQKWTKYVLNLSKLFHLYNEGIHFLYSEWTNSWVNCKLSASSFILKTLKQTQQDHLSN